ncbi:hypothetical protein LCGC14_1647420 [marine sediment metagenome]|uniref:Uncharacterized protein n=1 Tax=marine sediment metagenome TaxID=412755 RepID=A0A0F9HXS7_9ZZZZ
MSNNWRVKDNPTKLPDELWFIYMGYLKGYFNSFKEAVRSYEKDLRDPFCLIFPSVVEITGAEFIKKYLINGDSNV